MANNLIQIKRTSVSGRAANSTTLPNPGELALNMADGILYSTNGSTVFEVGANNTTARITNSLTIDNAKTLRFSTVNTSAAVSFTQQNDDNFVFYSTNTAYGTRAVWGIFANSITSNLQFYVPIQLNAGLVANSSLGTAGQVLTTNGTTTYWSTISGGGSVNVDAQYVWTNTQTFQNTITFSSNIVVGNSTVNVYANNTAFVGNVVATSLSGNLTGNVSATTVSSTGNVTVGANVLVNTSAFAIVGNTTTAPSATLIGTGLTVGNGSITGAPQVVVANSAGNTVINATSITVQNTSGTLVETPASITLSNSTAQFLVANTSRLLIGNSVALVANGTVGTSGQALFTNATGLYWNTVSASGSSNIPVQNTNPSATSNGVLFWNNDLGKLLVYYTDGTSNQFVEATISGFPGPIGPTGNAATATVGTTSTLSPGSSATVTNSGNTSAAVFDFGVPRGSTVAVNASVTTVAPTVNPSVAIVSNASFDNVVNFSLPRAVLITANSSVVTGNPGTSASVTVSSNATFDNVINFTIPRGSTVAVNTSFATNSTAGGNPFLSVTSNASFDNVINFTLSRASTITANSTVITGAPGTSASISVGSNSTFDNVVTFTIPRGSTVAVNSAITVGTPGSDPSITVTSNATFDNVINFTLSSGAIGPTAPKSITIPSPVAGDSYTLFWSNAAITLQEIRSVVRGTSPNVDATFFWGADRSTGTTISANVITSNVTTGNSLTSFANGTPTANVFLWVTINNVTGTVTEYHATLRF